MEFREVGPDRLEGRWGFDAKTGLQLGAFVVVFLVVCSWVPVFFRFAAHSMVLFVVALYVPSQGISLDRLARTVTIRWGILVPFIPKNRSLDGLKEVFVCEKDRLHGVKTYRVRLTGDSKSVQIAKVNEYQEARRLANRVAGFLK